MKKLLGLAFACVLAGIVAACGGGGGGPVVSTQYVGVASVVGEDCAYAVGVFTTRSGTASGAESLAFRTCESAATSAAAGAARDRCSMDSGNECGALAVGINSSGSCLVTTRGSSSLSNAQSDALQACRSRLGATANCELLVSGCPSGSPSTRVWRPSGNGGGGGVDRGQVGPEFGTTPTTGRTNLNLTCTDDVVFSDSGNVVLPSVDVVRLPSAAGTVTLEYDSKSIPDRFVVVLGGQVVIDTQYVGHENTVQGVNAVLTRYGFTPTSQASIISPGGGSRSVSKAAGVTSAVVRVYAPLTGTAWDVTLTFAGSSCPSGGGNGGGTPTNGAPQAAAARTLSGNVGSSWTWTRAELESAFSDPDGDTLTYRATSNLAAVASASISSSGLRIEAKAAGTATISVTATDPGGLSATWRITVTVNQAAQQRLFGAVAIDVGSNCSQHGGMVANSQSESSARTEAINTCVSTGGSRSECASKVMLFGSAYAGANQCASVAYGETRRNDGSILCGLYPGRGDTASAARQSALSNCRADRSSCQTSIAISGSAFGLCTD